MTWRSFKRGQLYEDVRSLHRRFGDYVRVGPSEISIADPAAFNAVHSATSQCERGPWYNILNPTISLQMVRDKKEHARRRRAWDKGFSSKGKDSTLFPCDAAQQDRAADTRGTPQHCGTTMAELRLIPTSFSGSWKVQRARNSTPLSGSSMYSSPSLDLPPFYLAVHHESRCFGTTR